MCCFFALRLKLTLRRAVMQNVPFILLPSHYATYILTESERKCNDFLYHLYDRSGLEQQTNAQFGRGLRKNRNIFPKAAHAVWIRFVKNRENAQKALRRAIPDEYSTCRQNLTGRHKINLISACLRSRLRNRPHASRCPRRR